MNNDNKVIKEKITLDILLKKYMKKEKTEKSTAIKLELINMLINNNTNYINVIAYYYDILNAAGQ